MNPIITKEQVAGISNDKLLTICRIIVTTVFNVLDLKQQVDDDILQRLDKVREIYFGELINRFEKSLTKKRLVPTDRFIVVNDHKCKVYDTIEKRHVQQYPLSEDQAKALCKRLNAPRCISYLRENAMN